MSVEEALKLNEKLKKEEPRPPDSSGPNVAQSTLMKDSLKAGEIDSTESDDSQSLEHEARNKTAVTRTPSKHFRSVNLMQQ
ncbi:hypothetical protein DPMN_043649 [Dreissena polymorpha]|uniref:Uncharacterized protein n=1 Tax=Dreissena polymorpha TaxID=45954 RepID=A0A9D4D4E5_DREPO|nr:hypothetical protein DPMN_043649 [Dreissena polymorpha]